MPTILLMLHCISVAWLVCLAVKDLRSAMANGEHVGVGLKGSMKLLSVVPAWPLAAPLVILRQATVFERGSIIPLTPAESSAITFASGVLPFIQITPPPPPPPGPAQSLVDAFNPAFEPFPPTADAITLPVTWFTLRIIVP